MKNFERRNSLSEMPKLFSQKEEIENELIMINNENLNTINQNIIPKDIFTTNFIDNDTQSNNDDTFNISLDMRNFFSSNYI